MSILQKYTIRHSCKNLVSVWLVKINSSSRLMIQFWQKTCWKPARASEQNGLTITRLVHTTLDLIRPPAASAVQDLSADFYNKITSLGFKHQRILSLSLYRHSGIFFGWELQFPSLQFYAQSRRVWSCSSEAKKRTRRRNALRRILAGQLRQSNEALESCLEISRKEKQEKRRKDVQQVPSAHYFICFTRSGLKSFIDLDFHSFIHPFMRLFFIKWCVATCLNFY